MADTGVGTTRKWLRLRVWSHLGTGEGASGGPCELPGDRDEDPEAHRLSLEEPMFPTLSRGSRPGESRQQVRRPRCRRRRRVGLPPTPAVQGQDGPVG